MYKPIAGYESAFGLNPAGGGAVSSLMTDLVAYWRCEEAGTANRVDAINSLALVPTGNVTAVSGKKNNAVNLEWNLGGAGYKDLRATSHSAYQVGSGGKTWAMWYSKFNGLGGGYLFNKGTGSNDEYYMDVSTAGAIYFALIGGDGSWSDYVDISGSAGDFSDGVSQLLIVWYDPADKKLRASINNGTTKVSASALSGTPHNGSADFTINRAGSTTIYGGLYDEMMLWDRPLIADERTELFNSGAGKFLNAGGTDFE